MRLSIILILLSSIRLWSQGLTVDFNVRSDACLGEQLKINNLSEGAISYVWDFCAGDLESNPIGSVLLDSYGGYGTRVKVIEQNGNYFGFFIGRVAKKLFRLDFGNDIKSQPTMIDIGDLGLSSSTLRAVEIAEDNGVFYGFAVDSDKNSLYRFEFGSSLTNTPTNAAQLYTNQELSSPMELSVVSDNSERFVFVVNSNNRKLIRFEFDGSLGGSINSVYSLDTSVGQLLNAVSFLKEGSTWYCLVVDPVYFQVIRLKFNAGLSDNNPALTILSVPAPVGIAVVQENGLYYAFVQSQNSTSSIFRINFGASIGNTPLSIDDLSELQLPAWGYSMYKAKSDWIAFATNAVSANIYKLTFPNECISITEYSTEFEPQIITTKSGSFFISLAAKDSFGNTDVQSKNIVVSTGQSPDIASNHLNNCSNNDVIFSSANNSSDITDYSWTFGDTQTSTLPNPTHQYSSSGEYNVQLNVTATNGCNNFTEKTIKIYDPPTSLFDLPSGLVCTNNEFNFINNTVDDFDGNLTYEWLVNDIQQSTARDFNYAFTAVGDQQVKLITSIPGCSNELTQTLLNVQPGPVVGFSFDGKCEDHAIVFTNESSGSISGFQWDFGNGNTSTDQNTSEIYSSYGNYNVSLATTGTNGCVSTTSKVVPIYSVPQTNFFIDLPPFACSGSPSQFNDITAPMQDSNITSWTWSFGDASNGSSSQKNPLYTYSLAQDYNVSLTTTTNFGCSNSIQKSVTIFPSPKADFSLSAACVNQPTYFIDSSTGSIKSWLWSIQGNTYSVKNPTHTFKSAANYPAILTVTGNNNCINQVSKNVNVPVPVVPDFSSTSTCATKSAVFDEISKGGVDPAVSWSWNFANQGSSTGSPATHVFPSTGNYSVTMNTMRQSGCVYALTKAIPIVDPPQAQFTIFLESGAAPFPVDFVNTSLNASSYSWKFGDAANTTSTAFSPSFTYTDLGEYTAELSASNVLGCMDSYSKMIYVVVPQINAAISDFRLEKISGSDNYSSVVTIENKSNVALIDPDIYLDLSGNALISEKIIGVIKPNEKSLPHKFTASIAPRSLEFACAEVKVTSDNYAFDNRQCVNLLDNYVSSIPYPNPASDELILEWINNTDEPMDLAIYNAAGQVIISRKYTATLKGLNQIKLDVSGLSSGIYFASYSVENHKQNFRFSVVR